MGYLCDLNENEETNPFVAEAVLRHIRDKGFNRYSDQDAMNLTEMIADYAGVRYENVLTFPGCDVAIDAIFKEFGNRPYWTSPEYGYVESLNMSGSVIDSSVIYLSSPNNPTGLIKSVDYPYAGQIVVDEAYIEFSEQDNPEYYEDVLCLRSFSKAFGLADLRLGYVLGPSAKIRRLKPYRKGKNVSQLAQIAGIAALDSLGWMHQYVTDVRQAKRKIYRHMDSLGIRYFRSEANFIFCHNAELEGASVRRFHGGIRITVGRSEKYIINHLRMKE